ncbi:MULTISPECIES: rRNA maturation RNase YbeY [unclassified Nitratiruptor]|uniref:rRNA maturation RNase YbeY n=1 Tax=unclassified Nitratiruptor TaxID=2624044 RepID=UPI00191537AC|nr:MULTISPECIES: rRNA maturation RNase YbeY [unclassified Nitratiruptor]BCD60493.1 probable rRNA maturation factor [Nitratiruptor sp. YY08-10]BCD64018.1 probable rRNA maturation factor [Nitratiruptor sp. YY08-14]
MQKPLIEFINETDFHDFDQNLLETITARFTDRNIELIIVDNKKMQIFNKTYRNIDKTTDVLSFPMQETPHAPLGSIVINADKVLQTAQELGHSAKDEFTLLYIHGLLHLLGYDHETDNGEMRAMEEELIIEYNLPKSLIIRTQE